jgi:DNA-binding PadR family transcriptional regulator
MWRGPREIMAPHLTLGKPMAHMPGREADSAVDRATGRGIVRHAIYRETYYILTARSAMGDGRDGGKLGDPALLILASLAGGARHGYAMVEDIERFSGSRLGPGTLYGAIVRLEERGLIEAVESADRRRPYRLTARGSEALADEVEALDRVVQLVKMRLAGSPN